MKCLGAVVLTSLLLSFLPAYAQGPDDQYVQIYNLIQEADGMEAKAQSNQALAKYLEAQTALRRFQKGYPDWNSQVVKFRLGYLEDKVAARPAKTTEPAGAVGAGSVATPGKSAPVAAPIQAQAERTSAPSDAENQ